MADTPAEMKRLATRLTNAQKIAFVEECRRIWDIGTGPFTRWSSSALENYEHWCETQSIDDDVKLQLLSCLAGPEVPVTLCGWDCGDGNTDLRLSDSKKRIFHCPDCSAIRRWNDGTTIKVSRSIVETGDFAAMPILADSLEDAGVDGSAKCGRCEGYGWYHNGPRGGQRFIQHCDDCNGTGRLSNPILTHLRGGERHCRECWCLRLLTAFN
jgi:hypothetical protein